MSALQYMTPDEIQAAIGERMKRLRLDRKLTQIDAAAKAGVSRRSLQKLESGAGSTLDTYVRVLKALGQLDTLDLLAPKPTVSPMELLDTGRPRQRAPRRKSS